MVGKSETPRPTNLNFGQKKQLLCWKIISVLMQAVQFSTYDFQAVFIAILVCESR
jgi:hypothetical protein